MATEHHTEADRAAWEARMFVLSQGIIRKHMAEQYAVAAEARKLEWDEEDRDRPPGRVETPIRPVTESPDAYALRRAREILQTVEYQREQLDACLNLLGEYLHARPEDTDTLCHAVGIAKGLTADTAALDALRDMIQP